MHTLKKLLLLLIINLSLLNLSARILYAQQSDASALGLTAIPPRLEVTASPGEVITKVIKVRNETKTTRFVNTSIKDFVVLDSKGTPIELNDIPDGANKWASSTWLQVSPSQFKLDPGQTVSLSLTILVPNDATPGGHYAVVLHVPSNETMLSESGNSIEAKVGTLVYITVPGDIKEDARVDFSAPKFSEFGPIILTTSVTNLSDIHISPKGKINITDLLGHSWSLPFDSANIFPETTRNFSSTIPNKWLLGRFKAELLASYGSQGQVLSPVVFFWVIPVRFILALASTLLLVLGILLLLRKKKTNTPREFLEDKLENLKNKYRDR